MINDFERFKNLCKDTFYNSRQAERNTIGTLGEKRLHAVLKKYYEPTEANHEVKVGRFVADIKNDSGITEIQTRSFNVLRRKLEAFLPEYEVTVVYPIAKTKWLCWIDEATGEVTKKRKSPKTGAPCDICTELYKIKSLLLHTNLRLSIPLLELEEYRILNGWSADGKKGATRYERIPTALLDIVEIVSPEDYRKLLPPNLPQSFTSKDFQKTAKLSPHAAGTALNVLHAVKAVERIGKSGNRYIYQISKPL